MLKEINLDGIFISPFAGDLLVGLLVFLPLRGAFDRWAIQRWVWHRSLFDISFFVILVSIVGLVAG
jgi:hypothetical protein